MILAGDVGGTKTNLALYEPEGGGLRRVRSGSLRSTDYGGLEALLRDFLGSDPPRIGAAAFGVAGPVHRNRTHTPNLAWAQVDGDAVGRALGIPRLEIVNDLVATALGVVALPPESLRTLQAGQRDPEATVAVIAAGTGLGMCALVPGAGGPWPMPSEGGHVSFAPRDEREQRLQRHLWGELGGRVSLERVVSGPGVGLIYRFLRDVEGLPEDPALRARLDARPQEAGALIGAASPDDPLSRETMALFARAYGAAAGDLALVCLARGGLYVAGGVAAKNLDLLASGGFLAAFLDKGRYRGELERIPLHLALDEEAAVLGAAQRAMRLNARSWT